MFNFAKGQVLCGKSFSVPHFHAACIDGLSARRRGAEAAMVNNAIFLRAINSVCPLLWHVRVRSIQIQMTKSLLYEQ